MELEEFKREIDPLILDFLDRKIKNLPSHANKNVDYYLNYLKKFLTEGKRIRPYLAYITYKAYGGKKDKEAINLLIFLELFHAFALIHDDIMDKADKRHDIPTAHQYIKSYVSNIRDIDSLHFGVSEAILLGDYLYSWTNELLNSNKKFEEKILRKVRDIFFRMNDEVFLGQMIDFDITLNEKANEKDITDKTILKTAYYSFVRPMHIGAALTGNSFDEKFFINFGKALGLAFQTQDDLLDIKYDESQTHKSSFNDIAARQQIVFVYHVFHKGSKSQKKLLSEVFGKKLTDSQKKKLRKVFEGSGAITYGEKIMKENFNQARKILMKQKMGKKYKDLFLELLSKIERRTS